MPSFIGMLGGNGEQNSGAPRAYLNLMVFDLNFQQVGNTLFKQISTAAQEDGSEISHEYISINPVTITEPGYVYIYLSNENVTPVEVFFDDFEVTHTPTDIVQKDDYYPFGLTFNSYSSGTENLYKYNGKEEQKETGLYDYGARMYDPAIGRWNHVDPMADQRSWVSPYNFVQNNPLNRIDPDGRLDWVANREGEVYWDENATSQATTKTNETYLGKSGTGIDEQTGNMLVYNSDGSIDQGMMSLGEVTVSATQSDHDRTMSSPVVQNMRANSERIKSEALPFARHMVRSAIDGAGYTGAGITALGGVVVPFVPPIGAGLIGVGGSVSTIAGGASTLMYAAEGDYKSAAIEGSLTVSGSVSGRYLQNMASPARGLINSTTDLPILQGLKNTSFDIVNIIIVPKIK
ncbi:RHS repeat-associated core domain-containing protein [Algoriphagus sp. C2-6-M1]|uniref:RHS repeat-associated core domain-containing protein n=1 Tax=Algoriphagus persicinus TaxID=3108754 RepID=UPI002B37B45D|nr:RHS repeat-associated core domain-containing protein [Algoriphagus sp. C2-6-M1]MEB2780871.1 RHS repeat-associated core domain-containing protein [Algoriphagus sp. C2-6-M1]